MASARFVVGLTTRDSFVDLHIACHICGQRLTFATSDS